MFDHEDADDSVLAAALLAPATWLGLLLVVGVVLLAWQWSRESEEECARRVCPEGTSSRLLDHDCLCVAKAKEPRRP